MTKQNLDNLDTKLDDGAFEAMKQKLASKIKEDVDLLQSSIDNIEFSMSRLKIQLEEKMRKLQNRQDELNGISSMTLENLLAPKNTETVSDSESNIEVV